MVRKGEEKMGQVMKFKYLGDEEIKERTGAIW